jgi:hypothetical protein
MQICQNCNKEFAILQDGFCEECFIYLEECGKKDFEEYITITREMAMDAGDLQLEGQLWN